MKLRNTTKKQRRIISIVLVLAASAVIVIVYLLWTRSEPATGRIYLSQSAEQIQKGEEVAVSVRLDSYQPIDTVTATVQYDSAMLTYKETKYDKTRFASSLPAVANDDTVMVQAAILGGKTIQEDAPVATLVFLAQNDGKTKVLLSGGNAIRAGTATHPQLEPERKKQ